MALFGPKDAKLPRLTTFYQVDDLADPQAGQDHYDYIEHSELFQWLVREKHGIKTPPYKQDWDTFWRLRNLHRVVKTMMDELCVSKRLDTDTLTAFSDLIIAIPQERQVRRLTWDDTKTEHDQGKEWVLPSYIYRAYIKHPPFDYNVGLDIAEAMIDLIYTPEKLLVCDECSSIFLARRMQVPAQRFCSNRCQHRQLMRERTREQKTEKA